MGREARHTAITIDEQTHEGDALLETDEVLLRIDGEPKRRKLRIETLTKVRGVGETIAFEHDGHRYAIAVKDGAAWAKRITSPPTLLDKLGIARGSQVHVHGIDDRAFGEALRAAEIVEVPLGREAAVVVWGITKRTELSVIAKARRAVGDALALWIVYPKGKKEPSEDHVRDAAIDGGLVDVKVARFSETLSALKLVVRKSERKT